MQVLGSFTVLLLGISVVTLEASETHRTGRVKKGPRFTLYREIKAGSQDSPLPARAVKGSNKRADRDIFSYAVNSDNNVQTVLINFGDGWINLLDSYHNQSNVQSGQTTSPATRVSRPRVKATGTLPYSGEWIRLRAQQGFLNGGIVEVYRAGRWGLVCDDSWSLKDANVACRQLGFKHGAQAAPAKAFYGLPPGRWRDSDDIIMDDVECDGSESSLQLCQYEDKSDCLLEEAASVICRPNTGCGDDWIAGDNSCYRFFGGAKNIKEADTKCQSLNASLVSVESWEENHFLSNIISLSASSGGDHIWYTSGKLNKQTWRWHKLTMARARKPSRQRRHLNSPGRQRKRHRAGQTGREAGRRLRQVRAAVEVSRWFPGWGESSQGREPSAKKGHTCLVLTDQFPLRNGTMVSVDYYFWAASRCRQKGKTISFVCETPAQPQPKDCYTGNGERYRGGIAHTDIGTPCISWALNRINDKTHPRKGLGDHNFCRNPDGDKRPWCWVAPSKFGFCPVPVCSASPTIASSTSPADNPDCPQDEFFCKTDKVCLSNHLKCDGEVDCGEGEDESNCTYNIEKFDEYINRIPQRSVNNITYVNLTLETCATYCLVNTYFTCNSFLFNEVSRLCMVLDAQENIQSHLLPSDDYDYYLLRKEAADCTGKFRCVNGKCIATEKMCNGRDDCGDLSDEFRCASQPAPVRVRLMDGDESSGRVEVHYMNEWGTVCDDSWDIKDANVVCRMLGYPGAVRASALGEFGAGRGNIMLDEVECTGNENSLQDCPAAPWKKHDCLSFEAAGVECRTAKVCAVDQFSCRGSSHQCVEAAHVCDGAPSCRDGSDEVDCELKVVLSNGTSPSEGRVELIRNGVRGTVCDDDWDKEDAQVVCRMLGYRYGGEAFSEARFGQGSGAIWLDEVNCRGTESSLADCVHQGWANSDCSHLEDAAVRCHTTRPITALTTTTTTRSTTITTKTTSPPVRVYLVNGTSANQGRVEMEVAGNRGTICDDSFDNSDAAVVCRMAGFDKGGRAVPNAFYGAGSSFQPILLDEVDCTGWESSVLNCRHQGLGSHNCRHSEDVGVFCYVGDNTGGGSRDITTAKTTTRGQPTGLDEDQCGLRPWENRSRRKRQTGKGNMDARLLRIHGGDAAQHGMYPWQVGIRRILNIYSDGNVLSSHWCGGTIINRYWIVTAAHCFDKLTKSSILLKMGEHSEKRVDSGEQAFLVEKLIIHPNYDKDTQSHDSDIALMKVKSKDGQGIKFNDHVQPACLPSSVNAYSSGTLCHISGWGSIDSREKSVDILHGAEVPLMSSSTCGYLYKGAISRRMLCAGYLSGGVDTCQGDSGGPLVCKINDAYTLLGVTSWGFGCARPRAPGVYTKIIEFLPWIQNNIRSHTST